jgi:S-formylglutathione hydrolase FrmB
MTLSLKVAVLALALTALSLTVVPSHADPAPTRRLVTLDVPSPLVDTHALGGSLKVQTRDLKVNVLLPAGYDDHPDAEYPVLYLLHGANGSYDDYINGAHVDTLLGGVPAVIVMPDGGVYGMYSNWWRNGTLPGPDWVDYHLGTVRNLIEQDFRIRPGRRWHAIAGISMGGQGTLRYAAMLPGYFGSAAGLSPALPDMRNVIAYAGLPILAGPYAGYDRSVVTHGDAPPLISYDDIWGPLTGAYAKANNTGDLVGNLTDTRLYLTSGTGLNCFGDPVEPKSFALDSVTELGIRTVTNAFANKARNAGVDVTERRTCGVHTGPVWTRAFTDILATWDFFAPVPEDPTTWTYKTGMRHGTMWQFDYVFSAQPGFDTFTRTGSTIAATGSGTVTLSTDGCTFTATLPFRRTLPSGCHPSMTD